MLSFILQALKQAFRTYIKWVKEPIGPGEGFYD